MAAPLDASIANLQEFCALLAGANVQLTQQTEGLEERQRDLAGREGESEQRFAGVGDHLRELVRDVEDDGRALGDRLGVLADLAGGDERLGALAARLEAAPREIHERLESEDGSLQGAFAALAAQGFGPLGQALQDARSDLREAVEEAGEASDALGGTLAATGQWLQDEEEAATRAFDEAADGARDTGSQEIARAGDDSEAAWSAEVPAAVEQAAGEAEAEAAALYAGWSAGLSALADERAAFLQDAGGQAAAFCAEQGEHMKAETEDAPLDALSAELERGAAVLEAGEALAAPLEGLIEELAVVRAVVGQIDHLLRAME